MDHISGTGAKAWLPMLHDKPWAGPPHRPNVVYVPRFRNVKERDPRFIRGYGLQGSSQPDFAFWTAGFGSGFKQAVKHGEWTVCLKGYGECLPRWENFVELDPAVKDAWGIPALRISAAFGDNDRKLSLDARDSVAKMLEAAGARDIKLQSTTDTFGNSMHDVGTARMGSDPTKSVLNQCCQTHDVRNLFVMDGGCFVTSPCQNPTLTMMAIACRSCDWLIDEFRKGEV